MLMRCPDCHDLLGHDAASKPCEACGGSGFAEACVMCNDAPQDALRAPFCSNACAEDYETKRRLRAIKEARR